MKIILGSQSKQRQQILKDMGYDFEIISPDVDEKSVRDKDPRQLVLKVARLKSDAVAKKADDDSIIIASDSIVLVNGEIREKAKDKEQAYKWLEELSNGVSQTVVTSLVITNTKTGQRQEGVE
ncbi:MAG: septum formation inhibitor Maf, partial [Parcubacteria group bacterium CG10_big_fil_rev_8_21_14_0_10_41_35]